MQFDKPHSPSKFDELVEVTGAKSVDWLTKHECCGSPLWGINDELSLDLTENKLKNAWDGFIILLTTFAAVEIPARLVLDYPVEGWFKIFDISISMFFLMDVAFNFRSVTIIDGKPTGPEVGSSELTILVQRVEIDPEAGRPVLAQEPRVDGLVRNPPQDLQACVLRVLPLAHELDREK